MTLRNRQWQEHVDSVLGDLNKSSVIPSKGFEAWEEIAIGLPNAFKCLQVCCVWRFGVLLPSAPVAYLFKLFEVGEAHGA